MQPHQTTHSQTNAQFQQLRQQYQTTGITYKSNQIIHKISILRGYPYQVLLQIVKQFHMNQFQVIFFCHILNDQQNSYQIDPQLYNTNMPMPEYIKLYNKLSKNGEQQIKVYCEYKNQIDQEQQQQQSQQIHQENNNNIIIWSLKQLKKLYVYLLVIGYSVKYYLNQSTKVYEDQLKRKYPEFFTTIFNIWVDKYSNKVLRTNPRKINQFYILLSQNQEPTAVDTTQIDCQYRNYNQIVEELIKATSDIDEGLHEEDKEFNDN